MSLIAEQPLLISLGLAVLAGGFIYGWLETGKKGSAIAGLIVALLIPLAWVVAAAWETDREKIESLVYEIATAVENNDHDTAVKIIADPETQTRARIELQQWTFELARVNRIRSIDVIEGTYPPEADVDMSVKVDVSQRSGSLRNVRVLRRLILKFQKNGDDWVVVDYQHMPVTGGPDRYSTVPSQTPNR